MNGHHPCPFCAEPIRLEAIKCRHCGEMLPGAVRPSATSAAPAAVPAASQDGEHLRLLVLGHYALAGVIGFFACIPLIHFAIGLAVLLAPEAMKDNGGKAPPAFMGWLFLLMGATFVALGWSLAGLVLYAGRSIKARRRYTFCLVVAGLCCLFMPFGTMMAVFDFIVLSRPTVKALFSPSSTPRG